MNTTRNTNTIYTPGLTGLLLFIAVNFASAQGTWSPVTNKALLPNGGVMILRTDGSVMMLNMEEYWWCTLTPDETGSYINGAWGSTSSMNYTRLYCSSQVLKDGRIYVAGGEYGSGCSAGEVYDPLTDAWM